MAVTKLLKSPGLSALAAALALLALPVEAMAQERGGGRWFGGERGGDRGAQSAPARENRAAPQQAAPQQSAPRQAAPERGGWAGRGSADNAPRWGSQRPEGGERYGRNRSGGEVARPAPAWRGVTPHVPQQQQASPQRGWQGGEHARREGHVRREDHVQRDVQVQRDGSRGNWQGRNRDYADANRDRSYGGNRVDRRHDRNSVVNRSWGGNRQGSDNRRAYSGNHRRWDRDWRHNNRYNWSSYRNHNRQVFSHGNYYAPYRNYYYRPLSIGFYMDSMFYSDRYWINDPWQYRLPEAYGPYRWVRYYDDALLVDIYSGEVVDVIRDFFW